MDGFHPQSMSMHHHQYPLQPQQNQSPQQIQPMNQQPIQSMNQQQTPSMTQQQQQQVQPMNQQQVQPMNQPQQQITASMNPAPSQIATAQALMNNTMSSDTFYGYKAYQQAPPQQSNSSPMPPTLVNQLTAQMIPTKSAAKHSITGETKSHRPAPKDVNLEVWSIDDYLKTDPGTFSTNVHCYSENLMKNLKLKVHARPHVSQDPFTYDQVKEAFLADLKNDDIDTLDHDALFNNNELSDQFYSLIAYVLSNMYHEIVLDNSGDITFIDYLLNLIEVYKGGAIEKLRKILQIFKLPAISSRREPPKRPRLTSNLVRTKKAAADPGASAPVAIDKIAKAEHEIKLIVQSFGNLRNVCNKITYAGENNFDIESFTSRSMRFDKNGEPLLGIEFKLNKRILLPTKKRQFQNKDILTMDTDVNKIFSSVLERQTEGVDFIISNIVKVCSYRAYGVLYLYEDDVGRDCDFKIVNSKPEDATIMIDSFVISPKVLTNSYGEQNTVKLFPIMVNNAKDPSVPLIMFSFKK